MKVLQSGLLKIVFIIGVCTWSAAALAEIYKWRDKQGVMNYSDTPPPASTLNMQKTQPALVPSDWPLTRADADKPADSASNSQKTPSDIKPARDLGEKPTNEVPQAIEALHAIQERSKAKNCASARSNYRNYSIGGRMQNVTENGEREFMSDQQIQEGLLRAQQEIEENCPPE